MTNALTLRIARAICRSESCEGQACCQHPANRGREHCPAWVGKYDEAALAAIEAFREYLRVAAASPVEVQRAPPQHLQRR